MASKLFDLGGRLALVTGSSQGIGYAIVRGLVDAGARVVLNGRDPEKLGNAARLVGGLTAAFDVTDPDAVEAAVERIELETGAIEILVNNAGIQRRERLDRLRPRLLPG